MKIIKKNLKPEKMGDISEQVWHTRHLTIIIMKDAVFIMSQAS